MTLLQDIQQAAAAQSPNATMILRQCLILASRLQHQPLKSWAANELNGYDSIDNLPDYRIVNTQSYGNFRNRIGQGLNHVAIPVYMLPEDIQDRARRIWLMEGIEAYVDMLSRGSEEYVKYAWSADEVGYVAPRLDLISGNALLQEAWQLLPMSSVANLVASVVTRALDFSLAIELENPDAGEARPNQPPPILLERVNQVFNQTIFIHGQHNVSVAGSDFSQQISHGIKPGDLESLVGALQAFGLPDEDISELQVAVNEGNGTDNSEEVRAKVRDWFGALATKAAEQAVKQGGAAGADAIGDRLPQILQLVQGFLG